MGWQFLRARLPRVAAVTMAIAITVGAVGVQGCAVTAPRLTVTAAEDLLGLSPRLVFSATRPGDRDVRGLRVANPGPVPIVVRLAITGQDAGAFGLAPGQPDQLVVDAGSATTVRVRFAPTGPGSRFATLTLLSGSTSPVVDVDLRGVLGRGTVGSTEPSLAQLLRVFGYSTDAGFTSVDQATSRSARGDEVVAPYFTRVDRSRPVRLVPIARYSAATPLMVDSGRTPPDSPTRISLYRFAPDRRVDVTPDDGTDSSLYAENQTTFPAIASGTTSFVPSGRFGIYGSFGNYTDDRFNVGAGGELFRNVRVYPAKDAGGARVAGTWILAVDVHTDGDDKNYDHQDQVMVLTNARPA
jgi:hypothetical protein